jgi:hypothetical protein
VLEITCGVPEMFVLGVTTIVFFVS